MKTALWAKTKLGFIDETVKKPTHHTIDYINWEKANSMVMAWIINSTYPKLHGRISHATTARDVWLELWRILSLMQKEEDVSMTDFYTKFKSLLDELSELQPLPKCTCRASKELMWREEDQWVHLFIGSLDNEQYGHVKTSVLNVEPLPSLRRTFNHVLRKEACLTTERERNGNKSELGTTFHSSWRSKQKGRDGARPKCEHCGKIGHTKAKYFEIMGYPSHWDTRKI